MNKRRHQPPVVQKSERALERVQASAKALQRKARNARAGALWSVPLFILSLCSGLMWMQAESSVWSSLAFVCLIVAPSLVGALLIRWSIRRALELDRQATARMLGQSHTSQMLLNASNKSNVSASTTSAGIARRMWSTRFKRVVNLGLLAMSGGLLVLGVAMLLLCIVVLIDHAFVGGHFDYTIAIVLGSGVVVTGVGVAGCMSMLKSEQHLIEAQESLVEVGTYLEGAAAQPGGLQLADSLSERGQLSLEHQPGELTQTPQGVGSIEDQMS